MTENKNRSRHNLANKELGKLLDNIFFTQSLINVLQEQREKMRCRLIIAGIPYANGQYLCGDKPSVEATGLAKEAQKLDESIVKNTAKLLSRQRMATSLINKISDYRARLVLIKRYIDNKSAETIAEEMNYSPRHVQRMLKEATVLIEKAYIEEKQRKANSTTSV